jgi:uncharacterized protein with von Willebrand factor type A (vWA) domain
VKITVTRDDGTEEDITRLVQIAYDVATHSMDWGSGFLDLEETYGLVLLAERCGFPDVEEKVQEVFRQKWEESLAATCRNIPDHRERNRIREEMLAARGAKRSGDVKPTPEEREAFIAEVRTVLSDGNATV